MPPAPEPSHSRQIGIDNVDNQAQDKPCLTHRSLLANGDLVSASRLGPIQRHIGVGDQGIAHGLEILGIRVGRGASDAD